MVKKVLLISLLVLSVAGGYFIYHEFKQKPTMTTTLSARSKDFLKRQEFVGNSELQNVNIEGPSGQDTRNTRIGQKGCFSFVIPYRVTITNTEDSGTGNTCYVRYAFDMPTGAVVAYKTMQQATSWDDVGGVAYRRRKTDEYFPEERKMYNGREFILFKSKNDMYEKNAFYLASNYVLVFNLLTKSNENLDSDMDKMLMSLEID
jgi:hypothetical protein